MNRVFGFFILLFFIVTFSNKAYGQDEFPVLRGPYFGQKLPGEVPEVFAPDIISVKGRSEMGIAFTPDLQQMYFTIQKQYGVPADIYYSTFEGEHWSALNKANFTKGKKAGEMEPNVSHNGKRVYFTAYNADFSDTKIWYVERINGNWSNAVKLDSSLNQDEVMTSTLATNGDIFYTNLTKGFSTYYARSVNGKYPNPKKANIEFGAHAFISPSQDYLLVDSRNREDKNRNDADLYVYFKLKNGEWSQPKNLGPDVNSNFDETVSTVSPDGKLLFFSRRTHGDELDLYWVSTSTIERLRPKD